jgi:hypothetical protein
MTLPGIERATFLRELEKNVNYFSAEILLINFSNLSRVCNETLTVMIATARRCSTRKLHVVIDCLQQIRILNVIRPFVLPLHHGYLPPKEHKINKRTCNVGQ